MKCPFCIKICRKCKERIGEARLLVAYKGNFAKMKTGKYGFASICKGCKKKYNKDNSERLKQYHKQWHKDNSEHVKQYNKQYYKDNPEYFKQHNKQYYEDNFEHKKEYYKEKSKQQWDKYLKENGLERSQGSIGEQRVRQVLTNMNIQFEEQYRFNDCKFNRPLPFDFYIPHLNIAIEYDGIQHFEIVEAWGGIEHLVDNVIRDTIKNIYCRNNNIRLIRIPYWDFDRIEEILSDLL